MISFKYELANNCGDIFLLVFFVFLFFISVKFYNFPHPNIVYYSQYKSNFKIFHQISVSPSIFLCKDKNSSFAVMPHKYLKIIINIIQLLQICVVQIIADNIIIKKSLSYFFKYEKSIFGLIGLIFNCSNIPLIL